MDMIVILTASTKLLWKTVTPNFDLLEIPKSLAWQKLQVPGKATNYVSQTVSIPDVDSTIYIRHRYIKFNIILRSV